MLADVAREHAGLPAVIDGDTTLTFPELRAQSLRVAGGLRRLGVGPGDRVAVWVPNVWQWAATAYGIWELGAVIVPIGTRYRGIEAGSMLRRTEPRVMVGVRDLWGVDPLGLLEPEIGGPAHGRRFRDLPSIEHVVLVDDDGADATGKPGERPFADLLTTGDDVDPAELADITRDIDPDAPCEILFTSGTTGTPKAVLLGQWQMLRAHWTWAGIAGLRAGDRFLIVSPYAHGAGIHVGLMGCMSRGVANVPVARFDPVDGATLVERHRVTALLGPPALYQYLLEAVDQGRDLSSLRVGIVGTASVPTALIERIRDGLALDRIVNAYGLTEGGVVAMTRDDDTVEVMSTTSGRALPGVEIRTVDDDGNDTARGEPGEIVVRSYAVALGYWDQPELAAASTDADGWFHTGDIGTLDDAGNVSVVDRKADMFIVGGLQRLPRGDREPADAPPGGHAGVGGRRSRRAPRRSGRGVRRGPDRRSRCAGRHHLVGARRDGQLQGAAAVLMVDALPLNANGKVDKRELRDRYVRATAAEASS